MLCIKPRSCDARLDEAQAVSHARWSSALDAQSPRRRTWSTSDQISYTIQNTNLTLNLSNISIIEPYQARKNRRQSHPAARKKSPAGTECLDWKSLDELHPHLRSDHTSIREGCSDATEPLRLHARVGQPPCLAFPSSVSELVYPINELSILQLPRLFSLVYIRLICNTWGPNQKKFQVSPLSSTYSTDSKNRSSINLIYLFASSNRNPDFEERRKMAALRQPAAPPRRSTRELFLESPPCSHDCRDGLALDVGRWVPFILDF